MARPLVPQSENNPKQAPMSCLECEALFVDWMDAEDAELGVTETAGSLDPATRTRFDAHIASCAHCAGLLLEARRGRRWLRMLHQEPLQPPAGLLSRILAETTGAEAPAVLPVLTAETALPVHGTVPLARPWQRFSLAGMARGAGRPFAEPRFLLTAAMAFFSITLTLNLLGVHVTQVRAADLKPGNLRRSVSRSFTEANARVSRYYDNLRIVYEFEARVREFRRNAGNDAETGAEKPSSSKPAGTGPSSQREPDSERNVRVAGPFLEDPGSDELKEVSLRPGRAQGGSQGCFKDCSQLLLQHGASHLQPASQRRMV